MNTEYITIEGDRWDNISYKAYGDASLFIVIQSANPFVPLIDVLPGGIKLQVPVLEEILNTDISLLPPWKRADVVAAQRAINLALSNGTISSSSFDSSFDNSFDS